MARSSIARIVLHVLLRGLLLFIVDRDNDSRILRGSPDVVRSLGGAAVDHFPPPVRRDSEGPCGICDDNSRILKRVNTLIQFFLRCLFRSLLGGKSIETFVGLRPFESLLKNFFVAEKNFLALDGDSLTGCNLSGSADLALVSVSGALDSG